MNSGQEVVCNDREESKNQGRRFLLMPLLLVACVVMSWQLLFMLRSSIPRLPSWLVDDVAVVDYSNPKPCEFEYPQRDVMHLPPVNISGLNCPAWTRYYEWNLLSYLEAEGLLYSSIAKSGSSTIRVMLRAISNGSNPEKLSRRAYREKNGGQKLPSERKFFFTFVRDPIERFLSAYAEVWRRGKFWFSGMVYQNRMFKLPPIALKAEAMALFIDRLADEGFWDGHLEPQTVKITNQNLNSCLPFNFIGRLENFEQDILHVFDVAKVKRERWIKTWERGRTTPSEEKEKLRQIFNRQTQARVKTICRVYSLDFLNFGYPYPDACKEMNLTAQESKPIVFTKLNAKNDRDVRLALATAQRKWNERHNEPLKSVSLALARYLPHFFSRT